MQSNDKLFTRTTKTLEENTITPENSAIAKRWAREKDNDLDYTFELLNELKKGLQQL